REGRARLRFEQHVEYVRRSDGPGARVPRAPWRARSGLVHQAPALSRGDHRHRRDDLRARVGHARARSASRACRLPRRTADPDPADELAALSAGDQRRPVDDPPRLTPRALLQKSDVVILDESLAALDPENMALALCCM